jgi:hypothetical protein
LNSRVPEHGIRIVLYALVGLLTVFVLLKYVTWSIYTETVRPPDLSVLRKQGVDAPINAVII